jgi:hypothetical protein
MTAWGDRAVEEVARALYKTWATRTAFDDMREAERQWWLNHARAAILAYHRVLREPSEEMIAAGWSPSVHDEDLVNVLRAMVGRAEEEIRG